MPVPSNSVFAKKTPEEILKEIRVGDVVSCLLDPVGPGTDDYRRLHGHECELTVTNINESGTSFHGEFYIKDLDALMEWITINDQHNDGSQIGERRVIPDIQVHYIEDVVERGSRVMSDQTKMTIDTLADNVTEDIFEREEPGSVAESLYQEVRSSVLNSIIRTVELELAERA